MPDLPALVVRRKKGGLEGGQPCALLSWAPLPSARATDYTVGGGLWVVRRERAKQSVVCSRKGNTESNDEERHVPRRGG